MIEIIVVILVIFAIIMTMIAYEYSDSVFAIMASVTWLSASLGVLDFEIPYQIYNATSGNVEMGVHSFAGTLYPITYLFMALGIVTFIGFCIYTLETMSKKKR